MKHASGFTLIELLVTIAVIAILSTLAIPSMRDALARQQLRNAAFDLANTLQAARSQAVLERRAVIVRSTYPTGSTGNNWNGQTGTIYDNNLPSTQSTLITWTSWYVFKVGANANYTAATNNYVYARSTVNKNVRVNIPNVVAIRFLRDSTVEVEPSINAGFATNGTQTFTVCATGLSEGRQVILNPFGNVSVTGMLAGVC